MEMWRKGQIQRIGQEKCVTYRQLRRPTDHLRKKRSSMRSVTKIPSKMNVELRKSTSEYFERKHCGVR